MADQTLRVDPSVPMSFGFAKSSFYVRSCFTEYYDHITSVLRKPAGAAVPVGAALAVDAAVPAVVAVPSQYISLTGTPGTCCVLCISLTFP